MGRLVQQGDVQRQTDAVMRWGVLGMVRDLSRRPSEPYEDVARGRTRPWALLLRRAMEAALAGAPRASAQRLVEALHEALDVIWGRFFAPRPRLRLLKPAPEHPELPRVA